MTKNAKQLMLALLIIFIGTLGIAQTALGKTYYVSTRGRDSGPGTQQRPWETLSYAASKVRPGDTVLIARGTYKPFRIRRGGTRSRKVTFKADRGARGRVTIRGSDTYGVAVWKTDHVVIDGLTITGSRGWGFYVNEGDHVTLRNSKVHNIGRACVQYLRSNFGLIEKSRIYNCGRRGPNGEGIYLGRGQGGHDRSRGHRVRNCTIYDTKDEAVDLKPRTRDMLIEKNNIYDIRLRDGGAIHVRGTGHVIRNNRIQRVRRRRGGLGPGIESDSRSARIYGNRMSQTSGCRGRGC